MPEIRVNWPRPADNCGTRVTSVMALKKATTEWPADAVYVGMAGKSATAFGIVTDSLFGKPWACLKDERGWRYAYVVYLRTRLATDAEFRAAVTGLHGKTLVCWCKHSKSRGVDPDCHADVLAHYAEKMHHGEEV